MAIYLDYPYPDPISQVPLEDGGSPYPPPPPPPDETPPEETPPAPPPPDVERPSTMTGWRDWFMALVKGLTPNSDSLYSLAAKLKEYGVELMKNAAGIYGKIKLPDGTVVDVGKKFSSGNADQMEWQWLVGGGPGPTPPTPTPTPAPFEYPDFAPPEFDQPTFEAPKPFSYPDYVQPTGEEVLAADPGYGLRLNEGLRALRNERSARGILKGGDTAKALMGYAGGLAAQEYGQAADRSFRTWQANRANAADQWDRGWRNLLTMYGLGYDKEMDEYNRALSTYGTNFNKAATGYGYNMDLSNFQLNRNNSNFQNLLDLYRISTYNLPQYQPSPPPQPPATS